MSHEPQPEKGSTRSGSGSSAEAGAPSSPSHEWTTVSSLLNPEGQKSEPPSTRRTFCRVCIGGMAALSAGMVGFPVVSFMGGAETISDQKVNATGTNAN